MSCGDPNSLSRVLDKLAANKEEFLSVITEACKRHNVRFVSSREQGEMSHGFVGPMTANGLQWRIDYRELNQRIREAVLRPKWLMGMTTHDEQDYYRKAAEDVCEIHGEIVDLGCWLGSTTISLLDGCSTSDQTQNVWAFDTFIWEEYMDCMNANKQKTKKYKVGDNFKPEFVEKIGDRINRVNLCETDLVGYKWVGDASKENGSRIKLLSIDVMKSPQLMKSVVENFYTNLTLGAVVIHQDYKHWYASWIHCLQYALRHHFDVEHEVTNGTTVSFKLFKPIQSYELGLATRFHELVCQEIEDVFEWSKSIVSKENRSQIHLAHIMAYVHRCDKTMAKATYHRLISLIDPNADGLDSVRNAVDNMLYDV